MGIDSVHIIIGTGSRTPIANDDFDTTLVNMPCTVRVLRNDFAGNGCKITRVEITDGPFGGRAVVNSDNTISYTPYQDYHGNDSLIYRIWNDCDPNASDTAMVRIYVGDNLYLIIHNVITPNGDGINDGWIIEGIEDYPDNTVQIFNRWGDKIHSYDHYNNTTQVWKGTTENDKKVPDGVYYYILTIHNGPARTGWIMVRGND